MKTMKTNTMAPRESYLYHVMSHCCDGRGVCLICYETAVPQEVTVIKTRDFRKAWGECYQLAVHGFPSTLRVSEGNEPDALAEFVDQFFRCSVCGLAWPRGCFDPNNDAAHVCRTCSFEQDIFKGHQDNFGIETKEKTDE